MICVTSAAYGENHECPFDNVTSTGTTWVSSATPADPDAQGLRIRGGEIVDGYPGVVDYTLIGFGTNCTGSMIAPDVVLTAAHCFRKVIPYGGHDGPVPIKICYYDPERGRRGVWKGFAEYHLYPTYNGTHGASDDIGVIQIRDLGIPSSTSHFSDTDYHDYLRIYSDHGKALEESGGVILYGAGLYTYSGASDNKLRRAWFDVFEQDYNTISVDTGSDGGPNPCHGDSGGPYVRMTSGIPTIAAVHANSDKFEGDVCASNNAPSDDARGCRTNPTHMKWIQSVTGIACNLHTHATSDYRRCFELPFIEDHPLEGTYDQGTTVAIAVAVVF